MDSASVTQRLRRVGELQRARGYVAKRVDMSAPAVTGRLRALAGLSDMCRRLTRLSPPGPPAR